jgi:hypothetical protein
MWKTWRVNGTHPDGEIFGFGEDRPAAGANLYGAD